MNGCLHVINLLFFFSVCALFTCVLLHVVGAESGKVFFGICELFCAFTILCTELVTAALHCGQLH